MEPCTFVFPHERLDAYQAAVELARRVRRLRWPARSASIRDQAVRASASVVLNIAEGVGRGPGDARTNFHRIALGSVPRSTPCWPWSTSMNATPTRWTSCCGVWARC